MKTILSIVILGVLFQGCTVIHNYCKDPQGNVLINTLSTTNALTSTYGSAIFCTGYKIVTDENLTKNILDY